MTATTIPTAATIPLVERSGPLVERSGADCPRFELPPELEAAIPPEARGITRDAVRLMVAYRSDNRIVHTHFSELPAVLEEGDLVVVNTSGTLAAEVDGVDGVGSPLQVHLSTRLPAGLWTLELRRDGQAWFAGQAGDVVTLADGGRVVLLTPYAAHPDGVRLWVASVETPTPVHTFLAVHGRPIRYGYVQGSWPISFYQNVYVTEPGSAEMPSAGRPFTPEVLTRLVARRGGCGPDHAAHRRRLPRGLGAPVPRAVPGPLLDRRTASTTRGATAGG